MVVVSLIGLLLGMLVPTVSRSMDLAAATICKSHLREIGTALILYRYDNDGWLPANAQPEEGPPLVEQSEPWFAKLFYTYLSDPVILTCPKDPLRYRFAGFHGDLSDPNVADYSSYGINGFIMTARGGKFADLDRLRPRRPLNTILIADTGPDREPPPSPRQPEGDGPIRSSSMLYWDDGFDPFVNSPFSDPWVTMRHDQGIHMATLTGGVREAETREVLKHPVKSFYEDCASGGCTFCNQFQVKHYSFARNKLYWWTGPVPLE